MKDVIILPTYNERENIGNIVPMIFSVVPDIYILVADDNSPDGTADVVRELQKKYKRLDLISRPQKNGLGRAYINAFKHVLKDTDVRTVIMMDADLSHQPKYLPEMLKKSYDFSVVTGSRYVKGGETVGWETWRVILSFLGNFYCRNITGMPIMDCTAGFNVISTDLLRKIDFSNIDMSGYAFIMELKYNLHLAGGEFYEVPITFVNRVGGESKMSSHIISEGVVAPWKMRFKVQSEKIEEDVKKINCVGCLSKEKVFFGIKNNLPLYKCLGCGMLSLYELPESSSEVYDAEYFSGGSGGFGYVNYDEDKEPMRESFKKYLDLIKKVSGKSGKLFDVGAATGFFMSLAKDAGFEVSGVEISDFAAQKARDKKLDVLAGTLADVKNLDGSCDVVTLLDVLEHMPDPETDIKIVGKMLRKGGLVVINTPDSGSFYARLLGMKWHLIVPPEHIHYFNEKSARTFLERNGFETIVVTRMGKKFTVEYIFNMLFKWLKIDLFQKIAIKLKGTSLGKFSLPTDFRDNMFVVAKKK